MPLIRINALGDRPVADGGGPAETVLRPALAALSPDAPMIVMIHGYKHSPSVPAHDPHRHMLSLDPVRGGRSLSWPKHLGFGRGSADEGLAIAFGWEARGSIWQAHAEALRAGRALACLIRRLAAERKGPVDLMCHSLGARVALAALPRLPARSIGRAILLSAAEFRRTADAAMDSRAGRTVEVLNVTSGENRLFDLMFERLLQPPHSFDRALSGGLSRPRSNWTDIRIDCPATRAHLAGLGFVVLAPVRPVCHWSGYMRPGLFPLYSALFRDRAAHPLPRLVPPKPQHNRVKKPARPRIAAA